MKTLFVIFLSLFISIVVNASIGANPLSFKEWKNRRIQESKELVQRLHKEGNLAQNQKIGRKGFTRMEQAMHNVRISQSLTAHDYFLLYLNEQFKGNPEALERAAKKMSAQEVADILLAYQIYRSQSGRIPEPEPFAKFNSTAPSR